MAKSRRARWRRRRNVRHHGANASDYNDVFAHFGQERGAPLTLVADGAKQTPSQGCVIMNVPLHQIAAGAALLALLRFWRDLTGAAWAQDKGPPRGDPSMLCV